jgi:hypothetical protein
MTIREPEFLKVKVMYDQIIPFVVVINEEDTLKEFYKELEKAKKENNKQ